MDIIFCDGCLVSLVGAVTSNSVAYSHYLRISYRTVNPREDKKRKTNKKMEGQCKKDIDLRGLKYGDATTGTKATTRSLQTDPLRKNDDRRRSVDVYSLIAPIVLILSRSYAPDQFGSTADSANVLSTSVGRRRQTLTASAFIHIQFRARKMRCHLAEINHFSPRRQRS